MRQWRLVLMATVLVLAGGDIALAQKSGGTLKIYHRDNPPSGSIHEEATISTLMPFMGVFNNLVVFDNKKSPQNSIDTVAPELATAWSWNAEKTKVTFTLRDDVRWHDGQPFTSRDVKCTWDMLSGKDESKLRKNPRKPWYFNLEEVTTDGDRSATFHLKRPQASFLVLLSSGLSPVYPCHVNAQQMRIKPIGTGPFKFAEFRQNDSLRFVRNPDYWKKGQPYLDAIEWKIIANRSTAILAFVAKQFDVTFTQEITMPLLADIKSQSPQAVCEVNASNTHANLMLNRDKPPFDDARVRKAMMLALDRQAFVTILNDGKALLGGTMLPPPAGLWGLPAEQLQSAPGFGPDIAKNRSDGRAIMQQLGYSADKPLKIKVATRNIPAYRDPTVILIDHLKQVHIEGEMEPLDTSVWYTRMTRKDYQVGLNVTGVGIDDPDVNLYENYGCGSERNYTQYCNPELEKLFDKQSMEFDAAKRREVVWDIDRRLQEDGARPVISHSIAATCWQSEVRGIALSTNSIYSHWRFDEVWLDR